MFRHLLLPTLRPVSTGINESARRTETESWAPWTLVVKNKEEWKREQGQKHFLRCILYIVLTISYK